MKTSIELQPCESCGGEVRSSLHRCDPKQFARHNAAKLGAKTLRVIGKILAKHDAGVIEGCVAEVQELREVLEKAAAWIDASFDFEMPLEKHKTGCALRDEIRARLAAK